MNKKFFVRIFALFFAFAVFTDFSYTNLKKRGATYKVFAKGKNYLQKPLSHAKLKNVQELSQSDDEWFASAPYIAHALGGIDGHSYTNSLDALLLNYQNGHRVFEADISITGDGVAVLAHDWAHFYSISNMQGGGGLHAFLNARILGKYQPMSVENLVDFMKNHSDVFIVTDKLFDEYSAKIIIEQIVSFSKNDSSILDRFIIQVYSEENFLQIDRIYHFKNYIYTTYCESENRIYKTALFCIEHNIPVITMWHERAKRCDIALLLQKGLHVYTHTVNSLQEVEADKNLGVTSVYTDFLLP